MDKETLALLTANIRNLDTLTPAQLETIAVALEAYEFPTADYGDTWRDAVVKFVRGGPPPRSRTPRSSRGGRLSC